MSDQDIEGLIAEFKTRAEPLGVDVVWERDSKHAAAVAADWVTALGTDSLILAAQLRERAPGFAVELVARGVRAAPTAPPEVMRDGPAGASLALLAIAETGSALLAEPTLEDRSVGMLCLSQLIVCPVNALVASLDDAAPVLRLIATAGGGSYATLVTGPSRTADIERALTIGVQGPGKVMVLFVDDVS